MKQTEEKNVGLNRTRVDPLFWELYDLVVAERDALEKLVRQLSEGNHERPYPEIPPKYRNPKDPTQTWCGRGLQPRWLRTRLQAGEKLADFLIRPALTSPERSATDRYYARPKQEFGWRSGRSFGPRSHICRVWLAGSQFSFAA